MLKRILFGKQPVYPTISHLQLFLLLVGIALSIVPHFPRLPLWLAVSAGLVLAWRIAAGRWRWPMPGRVPRMILALLGFIGVGFSYSSFSGETAGVALLIAMLTLKLTESASVRDGKVAGIFALFAVAAQALYSQTLLQLGWMVLTLCWLVTMQIMLTHPGLRLRQANRAASVILLQSLPVALLLFVIFPRLPGPLWGIDLGDGTHVTGLSDEMRLGDISNLAQSNEVAYRVEWQGAPPKPRDLYWRGPVLWDFDGEQWTKGYEPLMLQPQVKQNLRSLLSNANEKNYEVILEPHQQRWLFLLDMADPVDGVTLPQGKQANVSDQLQWLTKNKVTEPLRYTARSFSSEVLPLAVPKLTRRRALAYPEDRNPEAIALAQQWRQQYTSDGEIVSAAQRWYLQQQFRYTLQPDPIGADQIDDFLFSTKNGFCAHFASSFTILMRAAGVPARMVSGYQGGERNPLSDYMVVRQSQAHVWVEVWLEDRGWQRIDPTGWAAPGRLTDGLANALPAEARVPTLFTMNGSWVGRLKLSYDLMNYRWQQLVLGYDRETQKDFLGGLHPWLSSIGNLIALSGILIAGFAVLYSSWLLWRDRRQTVSPVEKTWRSVQRKLAKRDLHQRANESAVEFMARVAEVLPEQKKQLTQLGQQYSRLRYSNQHERRFADALVNFGRNASLLRTPRSSKS